jgi:5-amino-6-(5-phosphoribosylamino)uracil reductase
LSLVFVQSAEGNVVAEDPGTLGGGATDKHLVYEGLSRVAADAVLAGASTVRDGELVFSVWHPELVALRLALGRPRHPAQVVVTRRGDLPWDTSLLFTTPELRVCVVAPTPTAGRLVRGLRARRWIDVVDAGDPPRLASALRQLRERGVEIVSAVGGRCVARSLIGERLVQDLFLTTAPVEGGEPDTPLCEGPPPVRGVVLAKEGRGPEGGVRFEHLRLE